MYPVYVFTGEGKLPAKISDRIWQDITSITMNPKYARPDVNMFDSIMKVVISSSNMV